MKTSSKCVPCFFSQVEKVAQAVRISEKNQQKICKILARELDKYDFSQPPVTFGRVIYKTISRVTGINDLYFKDKRRIEKYLLSSSNELVKLIQKDEDPFHRSAKLCCAANAIDFGAGYVPDIKKIVKNLETEVLEVDHFFEFKKQIKKAKTVLFLGDNCGEIFFDRFFIEQIKKYNGAIKILYAVRPKPMINDALYEDAVNVGIDKFAKIISSGCDYPGVILEKTSRAFKAKYRTADIIVSKGQGNFESYFDSKKAVFYIFKAKCSAVSCFLKLPVDSLLFLYNKKMI